MPGYKHEGISSFDLRQILDACHFREHFRVLTEFRLELCQFTPELTAFLFLFERPFERFSVPFFRKWPNNLVQDNNCNFREFDAVTSVPLDDFPREREQIVNAVEGCLFVTVFRSQILRCDARQHFDVEFPRGGLVRFLRLPLHFQELEIDLQRGHVPILKPLFPFHVLYFAWKHGVCQCVTLQTLQTALYFIMSCSFVIR